MSSQYIHATNVDRSIYSKRCMHEKKQTKCFKISILVFRPNENNSDDEYNGGDDSCIHTRKIHASHYIKNTQKKSNARPSFPFGF